MSIDLDAFAVRVKWLHGRSRLSNPDYEAVVAMGRVVRAALADDRDALSYALDEALAPFRESA